MAGYLLRLNVIAIPLSSPDPTNRIALPMRLQSSPPQAFGRLLATLYSGAGLVGLAVYWLFQSAP